MMSNLSANMVVVLTSLLLLFAPIVRGGKTSMAAATMEILGLVILLIIFWTGLHKGKIARPVLWFIWGGLGSIVIYLIPLPDSLWSILPGREMYIESANWLEKTGDITVYKALSVVPLNTLSLLLACIPALAVFLAASCLPQQQVNWLIYALLGSAMLQSFLGVMQHYTLSPAWHFGVESLAPQGTYLNQNHLTALMEMAEPLALGMMIYAIVQPNIGSSVKAIKASLFAFISLSLTFIPLISSSRMGVVLLFLSVILSFWAMTTANIRKRVVGPIIALRVVLLGLAILVQLSIIRSVSDVVVRMEPTQVAGDLRWELWSSSWELIQSAFPFGFGPSTFQQTYRIVQSEHLTAFVNHAHNDYLQLILEFGIFGILLILGLLILYILQWKKIAVLPEGQARLLQSGAGIGVLLFMLYSLTDFNLHTPANAIFFAFLLGIFFTRPPQKA